MSYARMGPTSDVYVYGADDGFRCCYCLFSKHAYDRIFLTRRGIIAHLERHRERGHKVPADCVARIKTETDYARGAPA